jgi:anti-sigma regulatory factor (Ser/Thr protein kinase)
VSGSYTTILPAAGRLMTSLRDIGYDLPSAIADLVDNAIDANARTVSVEIVADGEESWVRVCDDGLGMTPKALDEAMRYGSETDYRPDSLGHFGLGLKTASLSQCRRLTVASRSGRAGRLSVRRWDLDDVLRRNSWDLERIPAGKAPRAVAEPLTGRHGSVVLWERLDRVLPRKPTAGMTARVIRTAIEDVREHLAMVLHRFIDGQAFDGRQHLELTVNGQRVEAWDPFARAEDHTRALPPQSISFDDSEAGRITVEVQPFVLPGQNLFSSPEAHRRTGGPKRWNRHQGFYIYRRDRLIQAGGWNRLRTLDEHAKLARIAVDLPPAQEERFSVDVAKMKVSIPEELRGELRAIASAAVAVAQERYRDHLDSNLAVVEPLVRPTPEAISISRDWPAIMAVVDEVLGDDPQLRDRLLLRLANADSEDPDLVARSA